jgi:RNA polymerase sigma factor (sigma-70 family)
MQRDTLSRYIADISHYPRITPEREKELSRTILRGRKKHEVEEAVNELVVSNLRLVVHCAKDFLNNISHADSCLTVMDLIAEGNVALMSAARSFDARFGLAEGREGTVKFSTYACKCIKRRMVRAVRLSRFIHIPEHHFTCRRMIAELAEDYDGPLAEDTISEELGITTNKLRMVREGQESYTYRLEDMTAEDGSSNWMDILENTKAVRPDAESSRRDLKKFIIDEILKLPPRTRKIILKVFLSARPFTFRELSGEFKVSKERCRQICIQGLNTLRRQIEPRWGKSVGIGLAFKAEESSRGRRKSQKLVFVVSDEEIGRQPGAWGGEAPLPVRVRSRRCDSVDMLWPQFDQEGVLPYDNEGDMGFPAA